MKGLNFSFSKLLLILGYTFLGDNLLVGYLATKSLISTGCFFVFQWVRWKRCPVDCPVSSVDLYFHSTDHRLQSNEHRVLWKETAAV